MRVGEADCTKRNTALWGLALVAGLGMSACSAQGVESSPSSDVSSVATVTGLGSSAVEKTVALIFDDLHGGSPYITVYSDIGPETQAGQNPNGQFLSGEKVEATCLTTGRLVRSDPSIGEEPRQSDKWARIIGSPGEWQFATLVYTQNPKQLEEELPSC